MKRPRHTQQSERILERLISLGFSPDVQQRLGAFVLVWGVFESNLELTIWALRGDAVAGIRPWTDKVQLADWLKELGKEWPQLPKEANAMLQITALAAHDLMEYRHAIIHGAMVPSPNEMLPTFIRNPRWHGEQRVRPTHDAHVDENLINVALDGAWTLCQVIFAARAACTDPTQIPALLSFTNDIARARLQVGELRHLTELMNHEKY